VNVDLFSLPSLDDRHFDRLTTLQSTKPPIRTIVMKVSALLVVVSLLGQGQAFAPPHGSSSQRAAANTKAFMSSTATTSTEKTSSQKVRATKQSVCRPASGLILVVPRRQLLG